MTVSGLTIAAIMGILLLVFIFSGYYLFAALGGVAILSGLAFWGPDVFQTVYFSIFKYCKDYNLLAVSDEMSTYLFVLMSFMGTAIAARRKAHLGLSIVTDRVSPKARIIIHLTVYAISALFCLLIVVTGVQMVISQYQLGQETANMQWPEWIYGSFVPVGAAFAAIAFLQTMVQMYKDYRAEEGK